MYSQQLTFSQVRVRSEIIHNGSFKSSHCKNSNPPIEIEIKNNKNKSQQYWYLVDVQNSIVEAYSTTQWYDWLKAAQQ